MLAAQIDLSLGREARNSFSQKRARDIFNRIIPIFGGLSNRLPGSATADRAEKVRGSRPMRDHRCDEIESQESILRNTATTLYARLPQHSASNRDTPAYDVSR